MVDGEPSARVVRRRPGRFVGWLGGLVGEPVSAGRIVAVCRHMISPASTLAANRSSKSLKLR